MSKFQVEGMDEQGGYRPDANGAPFMLFCPAIQDWLPGRYVTRQIAETVRALYERSIDYYAVIEFATVKLYRLDGDIAVWGGKGRQAPVATFESVAEFERFTKKPLREFNQAFEFANEWNT